jgi:thioredoxin 1
MIAIREINNVKDLTDFLELNKEELHIVKLGAKWCGPCRIMDETLKGLNENKIGNTLFGIVDIDIEDCEEIAMSYRVRSIPFTLFFKNGEILEKNMGALSSEEIYNQIERYQ